MRLLTTLMLSLLSLSLSTCRENPRGDAAAADATDTPAWSVSFHCESLSASEEEPRYALYAMVDNLKVKLTEINVCEQIEPGNFADYQIPADALAAAGGWWAGAGDYFFAQASGDQLQFFQGSLDEQDEVPNDFGYHLIASFQNGKFSYTQ